MDTKVIVGIVAAVIVVGAIAGVIIATQGVDDGDSDHGYTTLARTNELFPGHTCCVVIGKDSYMTAHSDETVRFLAGYVKGVNYLNTALADKDSEQYKKVMEVAKSQLKDTGITEDEIAQSLANITYLYQDSTGDLEGLKGDVSALLDDLTFDRTPDKTAIMSEFVDDTYIKQVSTATGEGKATATISVTVITGDIHQIGLHLANQLGFFEEYGITLKISYGANGGAIATNVMLEGSDGTDFGLLGAPPATINTVNKKLIEEDKSNKFHIVARVNSEGSGLYIKESVLDDKSADIPARNGVAFYTKSGSTYTISAENKDAWGGLVFATPGMTSIQHVQLSQIAAKLGLKFELFKEGSALSNDTIYFVTNLSTADKVFADVNVNAGIIWEPQFQRIITE